MESMYASVRRGLEAEGQLPGTLGVWRKGHTLLERAREMPLAVDRFLGQVNAYAFAVAEENASGGVIVTAPTCGAAGVMPALLYAMRYNMNIGDRALCGASGSGGCRPCSCPGTEGAAFAGWTKTAPRERTAPDQHSTRLTARPPSLVSLNLAFISRPVSFMAMMTASRLTICCEDFSQVASRQAL